ncbi:MAG TPA: PTS sugar transporter subunit IIA [bacterium]|nr:PTS sugar transporter subunit IIA [bacterium]HQG45266.1 PTS sugar transporter subunit IIA [bacterium]HQI48336.1 PTS sugar transporter subunit IIA [bacterium]HQJ63438.1 PTS sugar transporter subunit IIA [bacterium]
MRLLEYMSNKSIFLDIEAKDKTEVISEIVDHMAAAHLIQNAEEFKKEVYERERLGSTGIGKGIAIPHARTRAVNRLIIAFARLKRGVDFGAEDDDPVRLIFLLGTPVDTVGDYLKILAKLSRLLKEDALRKKLLKAHSGEEVLELLQEAEGLTS